MKIADTLSADLAVTVGVTGLQESGCLGGGECAGRGGEVLQEKPAGEKKKKKKKRCNQHIHDVGSDAVTCKSVSHFSSSSSMNPLLSWSMMLKAFFTSSADLAVSPQVAKNFL